MHGAFEIAQAFDDESRTDMRTHLRPSLVGHYVTPPIPPPTTASPRTLLPLRAVPRDDAEGWADAERLGAGGVAVIDLPPPATNPSARAPSARAPSARAPSVTAPSATAPSARASSGSETWAVLTRGLERLVSAGVHPLGHVSLGYATRPLGDVLAEIAHWAALPVRGVFLDHAPAGPYQVGPVVHAVRAARRSGLATVVLNPGIPVDPSYRRLEVTICTFEGSWSEYLAWSGEGAVAGDGHLVFDVPRHEWEAARALVAARHAGLFLITDRHSAYSAAGFVATTQTTAAAR